MSLSIGTKLGNYEIIGPLGAGGMGEVYRGRDLNLKRDVAIKALPDSLARDPDRTARFQREAQILASLNHPHIAAIYDLVESGDSHFLVLELVDGQTLADRLNHGPIDADEALKIATQICSALETAHEKGIIHRDLKPTNIKLTSNGEVKVLDFGLAKVREIEGAGTSGNDPTMVSALVTGTIMGTPAYLSPERVKGIEADRASDVWAFGCVLYEMLSGSRAFQGQTVAEVLAGILSSEPNFKLLPHETPAGIRRVLRFCLQKDVRLRFHDCGDIRIEIEEAQNSGTPEGAPIYRAPAKERLVWISALTLTILIAAASILVPFRRIPAIPEMRLEITTPPTTDRVSLAISPDGQKLVFVATSEGRPRLWLRSLNSGAAQPLAGTDFATQPFWSPDNRSLGFFAEGKLKKIDIDGGSAQTLANAQNSRGGTWNREGVIVFAPSGGQSLFRTTATGGEVTALTTLSAQQGSHRYPRFLPDDHHFVYYAQGSPETSGIYIGNLDGSDARRLLAADSSAIYAPSGHLLFIRKGTLFAQEFDLDAFVLNGNPFPVADQIAVGNEDTAALSGSTTGLIVYRRGEVGGYRQLMWFDRSGKPTVKVGEPIAGPVAPSMSPNGQRVALFRSLDGNVDIWLLEVARGLLTRFTSEPANDVFPIWSADGSRVVYQRNVKGAFTIVSKSATGVAEEQLLLESPQAKNPVDWSADNRFLLYRNLDQKTGFDLWAMALDGNKKTFPVVQTIADERDGQFSPDGQWVAYQSNDSGRSEIYVQSFPEPAVKSLISTAGGAQVRWKPDGKELFYIALDGRLMAVPIRLSNKETFEVADAVPLFDTHVGGALQSNYMQQYMVSPDGARFLMNTVVEETTMPITILLNWRPHRQ
jgi:eukaryotic-like serine/threonine-protein kinase